MSRILLPGLVALASLPAQAASITHTPASAPVRVSPIFVVLFPNALADDAYIDFGVDYSGGAGVAVFDDRPLAFAGVNPSGGGIDLLSPVVGSIVLPGTTTPGLTSSVEVRAGNADAAGRLLLEVFDAAGSLLESTTNPSPGTQFFGVSRTDADIASFRVSTPVDDSFGVRIVTIETPVPAVPEPTAAWLLAASLGAALRRRR